MHDGVNRVGIDRPSAKNIGPVVEAGRRREVESALGEQRSLDDTRITRSQLTVAIDVGDVGLEQNRVELCADGSCGARGRRGNGGAGGRQKLPARRVV